MHDFFFYFFYYSTKSEEGIFGSESWLLLKKKKIRRVNIPGRNIFSLGMAGTIRNGLVFKVRQNKCILVPN